MAKLVGYARVSTIDQDVQLQINALIAAGCAKSSIFIDKISGVRTERPGLDKCIAELESGDTLLYLPRMSFRFFVIPSTAHLIPQKTLTYE